MNILVSGGLGFIGSHTVVELSQAGHEVIIMDDLSNAKASVLDRLNTLTQKEIKFIKADVKHINQNDALKNEKIDGIIHFAAFKAVGESVLNPVKYYQNNLNSTIELGAFAVENKINAFVFSSSCTVYGDQESPFVETMDLRPPTNPYGATKQMSEQILKDIAYANASFNVTLLRYFNPIGAHPSGLIGESPVGTPNNLMPYVLDVARKKRPHLNVFGNDYATPDGTGIRDYIHVVDLAKAHVKAIERMNQSVNIYNVGTGEGSSVLDVIRTFEEVTGVKVPYQIQMRRPGDIAISYADAQKIERELGFKTELSLKDMVKDAWQFIKGE